MFFIFTPIFGGMIQFDEHIFKWVAKNHVWVLQALRESKVIFEIPCGNAQPRVFLCGCVLDGHYQVSCWAEVLLHCEIPFLEKNDHIISTETFFKKEIHLLRTSPVLLRQVS